ncbi:hypothetical protein PC113_g4714 [Phytophthora cactorum]|uniref:RxLR effector protein n=1 Tax=Phytophthora cactorum TaxID=29920 RepID=A0A8T0ZNB5_9STRA|nr:hypothetical protein PC113_g4714 [Phytophthora cactorum]
MRVCFILLAAATILQDHSETVSALTDSKQNPVASDDSVPSTATARIASDSKRLLRIGNTITQVIKYPKTVTIDQLLKTKHLDEILDPKRADAILAKGPLGGWLDKKTLDKVLNGDLPQKKDVFQGWRADKRTGRTVNLLIKSDPAIEKKYRFVYKMYAAYLKKTYREENLAKLAGNNEDLSIVRCRPPQYSVALHHSIDITYAGASIFGRSATTC